MLRKLIKVGLCLSLVGSVALATEGIAAPLESALDTQVETERAGVKSQRQINAISEKTAKLLAEYRQVMTALEGRRAYNRQLKTLIRSQKKALTSIEQQLADIKVTKREMVPLMLQMVSVLDRFVALDRPFLPKERKNRIAQLKALMDQADVALSEKYRRLINAYQVEAEYGRTIEAYRGKLKLEGKPRTVDFLRIGRVALFFQTLNGETVGRWDAQKEQWVILPDRYRAAITQGLRIARKQAPPDLLLLPVQAPEAAQ